MKYLLFIALFSVALAGKADEGMFLPFQLKKNKKDMAARGLELSTKEIYNPKAPSVKDAIVSLGGFCTGEIISAKGLMLTNHHCGFDAIRENSTPENDYLTDGFWAQDYSEEKPIPGLTASIVIRIDDVTKLVNKQLSDQMSEDQRDAAIREISEELCGAAMDGTNYFAEIKPFYEGNEFYLFVYEVFTDIRLVGAPPSAIGKFGGDTDNWIWPRHTGDFSVFRIYADKNNAAAEYNENNIPYTPIKSLPISLKPKQSGDFTLVYGFPGSTDQHYTSGKLQFYMDMERPARIDMRQKTLDLMKPAMNGDAKIRIQYASKQARIANAWKKWIGQIGGLKELHALDKKREFEEEYMAKAAEKTEWKTNYFSVINDLNTLQKENEKFEFARAMFIEYFYVGPEFFSYVLDFSNIANNYEKLDAEGKLQEEIDRLNKKQKGFFKNYNKELDQKIFNRLTPLYISYVDNELLPDDLKYSWQREGDRIYEKSLLLNPDKLTAALDKFGKKTTKKIKNDPAFTFALKIYGAYFKNVSPNYNGFADKQEQLMKTYVKGMLEMFPDRKMWADANSTMRIAYGKVDGSSPRDGMEYIHYTTIDGIMQKYDPQNPDFQLTSRFLELYKKGDYGNYAQDGELWVCFTASNHTTGGNSGSPVIDADGNLMGINFDRSWESTMSDFMFDESRCRNIVVDIRYVLWVIDKYGEASHLIDEMTFVK